MPSHGPRDELFRRGKCRISEPLLRAGLRCVNRSFKEYNFCKMVAVK